MDAELILADRRALLLLATASTPKSARTLSQESAIPITTTYRLSKQLVGIGALLRVRHLRGGVGQKCYVSAVDRILIGFMGGAPRVQVVLRIAVEFAEWR